MNEPVISSPVSTEETPHRLERVVYPENPRYRRIRVLSVLMDQSILLPNGYRIGLDPLLGLVPGIGDAIGALISCYLVYQSARLGVRKRVLLRMLVNVALDALVGSIPIIGDVFDAAWKANMRNLQLLDREYRPATPERPAWQIAAWMTALLALLIIAVGMACFLMAKLLVAIVAAVIAYLRP